MSGINVANQAASLNQLNNIALQAFGKSDKESVNGGAGQIGMLHGQTVKFNTHRSERLFHRSANVDVRNSCNELRLTLSRLADELVGGAPADKQSTMREIRRQLGLSDDGRTVENGGKLLDRTTVAKVVNLIGQHNVDAQGSINDARARVKAGDVSSKGKTTDFDSLRLFPNKLPLNRQFMSAFKDNLAEESKGHFFGDDMRCESREECTQLAYVNHHQQGDIERSLTVKMGGIELESGQQAKNMQNIKRFFDGNEGLVRAFCGIADQKLEHCIFDSVCQHVSGMYMSNDPTACHEAKINVVREPNDRYRIIFDFQQTNVKTATKCVDASKGVDGTDLLVTMNENSGYEFHAEIVFWDATSSRDGVWTGNYRTSADDPLMPNTDRAFSFGLQVDQAATSIHYNFENVSPMFP